MSVHKTKDGRWYVKYYLPGGQAKKIYFGRGPLGKQEAQKADLEIKLKKKKGEFEEVQGHIYLDQLARLYIQDRQSVVSESYIKDLRNLLNHYLLPKLCEKPVEDLIYEDVMSAMQQFQFRSLATRNRYMDYLKAIFNFGIRYDIIRSHPLQKWRKPKEPKYKPSLTIEDLAKIYSCAPSHVQWAIEVEWNLGLRPGESELFELKWTDIDFVGAQVKIYGRKTKEWRVIPINGAFLEKLKAVKENSPCPYVISYNGKRVRRISKALRNAAKKARIEYRVRMYDVRHLFATYMLRSGADLAAVSSLLGHKDISTTQRSYYELLQGEKERAVSLLPSLVEVVPKNSPQRKKTLRRIK